MIVVSDKPNEKFALHISNDESEKKNPAENGTCKLVRRSARPFGQLQHEICDIN